MNTRALKSEFFKEFEKGGKYEKIVELVKTDNSLIMCMRGSYVTIYYKSLQILKIKEKGTFEVDSNYGIDVKDYDNNWVLYFKDAKEALDKHNKVEKLEKEVQQALVKENNRGSICNETDYFILDIEYTQSDFDGRFDALAVYWPKDKRKNGNNLKLAFVEVKAGEKAISGTSSVYQHCKSVIKFMGELNKDNNKDEFLEDLEKVIEQQRKLGLWEYDNSHEITFSRTEKPQLIFVLVNYNPNSRSLDNEIEKIGKYVEEYENEIPIETLFAKSSFMGYGLYDSCMLSLKHVQKRVCRG
ncbi:MAG: hypothetical protein IJ677_09540 [Alphaproteobacteria bacterium]|nr:hypothetical protein [Alphaproteobacteria bacterium]MBR1601800.1 hypothetical protein [Alphaproteobacteria bacterium]